MQLDRAEAGTLAAAIADAPMRERTRPEEQVPQWLFAFDPAGMVAFRALALLAGHLAELRTAAEELAGRDPARPQDLSLLRAAVLESVQLWPTNPVIPRRRPPRSWAGGRCPPGRSSSCVAPFLHRDDERLPYADRFAPGIWLDGSARVSWSWCRSASALRCAAARISCSSSPARCSRCWWSGTR